MTEHHDHPRNEVTTNRNKEDISALTKVVGKNAEAIALVDKSLAKLTGKVTGAVGIIMVLIEVGKHFIGK